MKSYIFLCNKEREKKKGKRKLIGMKIFLIGHCFETILAKFGKIGRSIYDIYRALFKDKNI